MTGSKVERSKARFKACNSSWNSRRGEAAPAANWWDLQGERIGIGPVRILSRKEAQGPWTLWGKWWYPWGPWKILLGSRSSCNHKGHAFVYISKRTRKHKHLGKSQKEASKTNPCHLFNWFLKIIIKFLTHPRLLQLIAWLLFVKRKM